jgi:hypothetical protein
VFADMENGFVADVARMLRNTGVAAAWKDRDVSVKDLAEHLYATSYGVKQRVVSAEQYRQQMRVAVRIVCCGAV